jgi:hypothetical protein
MRLIVLGFLLAASLPNTPYRFIDKTESPHKRYKLAWGLPDRLIDWKRLENDDRAYFETLHLDSESTENYIVDARSGRRVATIAGAHYWSTGVYGLNHAALLPTWSNDEKLALVIFDGKWSNREITAIRLRGKERPSQQRIGGRIEAYVRAYLTRRYGGRYRKAQSRVAVSVYDMKYARRNEFTAKVWAGVPKEQDQFQFAGRFRLALSAEGDQLKTRLYGLRPIPVE